MRIAGPKLWSALAAMAFCACAWAGQQAPAQAPPDHSPEALRALMRRVSQNEVNSNDNRERLSYRMEDKTPQEDAVREYIETKDGLTVGRTLLVNGKPPSADRQQKDEQRLQKLLRDPNAVAQKKRSQQEDEQRITTMMKALPEAFNFQYDGTEAGGTGELIRLKFQPNPNFDPPNRETQVYAGMQGTMWIDAKDDRLQHIDAKLLRDVNFGWGILGHLDQGGSFDVRQRKIGDRWEIDEMTLNFTGKILMFKNFVKKEKQEFSNFRIIPDMSLAQAIDMLHKSDTVTAESSKPVHEAAK